MFLDTLFDIGSIIWDIDDIVNGEGLSWGTAGALALDVGGPRYPSCQAGLALVGGLLKRQKLVRPLQIQYEFSIMAQIPRAQNPSSTTEFVMSVTRPSAASRWVEGSTLHPTGGLLSTLRVGEQVDLEVIRSCWRS
jgi:hypothetical protein